MVSSCSHLTGEIVYGNTPARNDIHEVQNEYRRLQDDLVFSLENIYWRSSFMAEIALYFLLAVHVHRVPTDTTSSKHARDHYHLNKHMTALYGRFNSPAATSNKQQRHLHATAATWCDIISHAGGAANCTLILRPTPSTTRNLGR